MSICPPRAIVTGSNLSWISALQLEHSSDFTLIELIFPPQLNSLPAEHCYRRVLTCQNRAELSLVIIGASLELQPFNTSWGHGLVN